MNVLLGYFLLPESLPKERRSAVPLRASDFNPVAAIVEMGRKPGLGGLLVISLPVQLRLHGHQQHLNVVPIFKNLPSIRGS